ALEVGFCGELLIRRTELGHLKRLLARVHVVAREHEKVRRFGKHGVPDGLRLALVGTGGYTHAQAWRARRRRRSAASAEDNDSGHPAEHIPATRHGEPGHSLRYRDFQGVGPNRDGDLPKLVSHRQASRRVDAWVDGRPAWCASLALA